VKAAHALITTAYGREVTILKANVSKLLWTERSAHNYLKSDESEHTNLLNYETCFIQRAGFSLLHCETDNVYMPEVVSKEEEGRDSF
jgi:hypothetical protein